MEHPNKPVITKAPLSATDIKLLKGIYTEQIAKVKKVSLTTFILSIVALLLPTELWNLLILPDRMAGNVPEVIEPMYKNEIMVLIVFAIVILTPLLSYYTFVHFIKKDLKHKEKLSGQFEVKRIEHISRRVAENLDGLDTILHFEKNEYKINRHLFNKQQNPKFLNAQIVWVELATHSRTVLKQEVSI